MNTLTHSLAGSTSLFCWCVFLIHAAGYCAVSSFFGAHSDDILSAHFLPCRLPWTNWCIPIKNLILTSLLLLRFVLHIYIILRCALFAYISIDVSLRGCRSVLFAHRVQSILLLSSVIRSHSLHFRRSLFRRILRCIDLAKAHFSHHIFLLPSLAMHFCFIWCAERCVRWNNFTYLFMYTHEWYVCASNTNKLKST